MKSFFSGLEISALRLVLTGFFILVPPSAHASVYGEMLAEDWGWIPERAGLVAAESQGMVPKVEGKNAADFYQQQRSSKYFSAQAIVQKELSDVVEIPLTPPGEAPPNDAVPMPQGFCEITGEVSDDRLEPLAGVVIEVKGTVKTTETDKSGKFNFGTLPSGNVIIEASKLGYVTNTQSATALPGQKLNIRIALKLKPSDGAADETTLEEETVVGEFQESKASGDLFVDVQVTSNVSSGIDKAEFGKVGVSDAAGAVGKISGANIVGGKFAVVRGLADRYVTTQFNGALISSADPSRKAVQLDIFPTTALQGIDIKKTYSPDLPGDFGGGNIQIKSLNIPNERIAEFKYKIGTNSTFGDRMLVHPNRELGFWGDVNKPIPDAYLWNLDADGNPLSFDAGGTRITPGNNNNPTQRENTINAGKAEQALADATLPKVRALQESQSFMPKETTPEAAESWSMVYGDRKKFDNGIEVGFIGAFQHATHDEVNAIGEENRLTSPAKSWMEESYEREVDWSLYLGGGVKFNENNQINATYFRKKIATDKIEHGTGFTVEGDSRFGALAKNDATIAQYGASAVYNKEFWTIDPVIRDTELMQIAGQHKTEDGTRLGWSLTKSKSAESRPHSSTFQNGQLDFANPLVEQAAAEDSSFIYNPSLGQVSTLQYQTYVNDGNGSLDSSRETQAIEENAIEASLDIAHTFYFTDDEEDGARFEFSAGANNLSKKREQTGRIYLMRTASWERWVTRNPPAWWVNNSGTTPYSPGNPLAGTTLKDGSPLPEGFRNLGEYLAAHPEALTDYFNGYGGERVGTVPGTGNSGSTRANYVFPDAPYYINGSGLEIRNVDSDLTLTALYASGTFYADNWRIGGGSRWEEENKSYAVAATPLTRLGPDDPARFGALSTRAFIPSVFAGIDIVPEKSWVNVAWSRTVARPTFHEFLPIESVAQDTGNLRRGNPDLTETSIENMDAAFEWAFSESTTAGFSLFRKRLMEPIVVVERSDQGVSTNTYINGDTGLINGLEIEGKWKSQKTPFTLQGNYTFIDSLLKYKVNQGIEVTNLETRFPFQPGQILNLTLGWEPTELPWSAFLTTNFTDEYPTILRSDPVGYDVWLKPQFTLDLIVARKFDLDWFQGTLTMGVKNLTNSLREYEYRGGTSGGNGGLLEGITYTSEEPGTSYSIEFKAAF